jgi:hypothetical protein
MDPFYVMHHVYSMFALPGVWTSGPVLDRRSAWPSLLRSFWNRPWYSIAGYHAHLRALGALSAMQLIRDRPYRRFRGHSATAALAFKQRCATER